MGLPSRTSYHGRSQKDLNAQGAVSTAGVHWLQGTEQHLAKLETRQDSEAARQATGGSREALWQDVREKASPDLSYAWSTAASA